MPELDFRGKEFVRNHHLTLPFRPLVPDAEKSVGDAALDGSLIIHGDNLHARRRHAPPRQTVLHDVATLEAWPKNRPISNIYKRNCSIVRQIYQYHLIWSH